MLASHAKKCEWCGITPEAGLRAVDEGYCPGNGGGPHHWVSLQEYYDESMEDF